MDQPYNYLPLLLTIYLVLELIIIRTFGISTVLRTAYNLAHIYYYLPAPCKILLLGLPFIIYVGYKTLAHRIYPGSIVKIRKPAMDWSVVIAALFIMISTVVCT